MKTRIVAVGRLRPGPEATLISDYVIRFDRTGRALGLGPLDIREVEAKKSGMAAEAPLVDKAAAGAAPLIVLDEALRVVSANRSFKDLRTGATKAKPRHVSSSAVPMVLRRKSVIVPTSPSALARWSGPTCWPASC